MATNILPFGVNPILMIVTLLSLVLAVYMFSYTMRIKKTSPIGTVEAQCKDSGNPMIKVNDPTGKFEVYEGKLEKSTTPAYKGKNAGLQIRADLLNKTDVEWTPARVPMYPYYTDFHFITSSKGGRALITAIEYVRENYPQLDFINSDLEIIEAIFSSSDALEHDCKILLSTFEQDESVLIDGTDEEGNVIEEDIQNPNYMDVEKLKSIFEEIKKDIPNLPLRKGFLSMKQAMALIPEGTTAQEMSRYGDEILKGERMNNTDNYQKLLMWMGFAGMPIALAVIAFIASKVL